MAELVYALVPLESLRQQLLANVGPRFDADFRQLLAEFIPLEGFLYVLADTEPQKPTIHSLAILPQPPQELIVGPWLALDRELIVRCSFGHLQKHMAKLERQFRLCNPAAAAQLQDLKAVLSRAGYTGMIMTAWIGAPDVGLHSLSRATLLFY